VSGLDEAGASASTESAAWGVGGPANELQRLRAAAARWDAAGQPHALATLVKVEGSAYRRPGARVVIGPDGSVTGILSGGCLEREIACRALRVLEAGPPTVVRFTAEAGEDPFGFGAGCGGTVHVLLERVEPESSSVRALGLLAEAAASGVPHALATVFRADGLRADETARLLLAGPGGIVRGNVGDPALRDALAAAAARVLAEGRTAVLPLALAGGGAEALVEHVLPPVRLVVFGDGPDAGAVVRQGATVGWHVTVAGTRPARELRAAHPSAAEWVPLVHAERADRHVRLSERTAAVVMTHNYVRDRMLLERLVRSPAPYVGVVGNRRRFADLLADLAREGAPLDGARGRLFGPAGLDVGAETPEEIALAIVAEAQAVLAGRGGGPLRARPGREDAG
jgi:xanthine/CO dehydrogenase XdhC/CoxF family maturation factor